MFHFVAQGRILAFGKAAQKVDVDKCHACHAKCRGVTGDQAIQAGHKCHACPAKRRWMSPSATPATCNEGGCRQVPRLPRKAKVAVTKCHAYHAKRRWMSPSATPATQSEGGCRQVPRLPRLPRKTKVNASKCHACHAKCRGVIRH